MAQTLRADMALRDSRHSDFRLEKSFDTSALFLRPSLISRILYPIAEPNSLREPGLLEAEQDRLGIPARLGPAASIKKLRRFDQRRRRPVNEKPSAGRMRERIRTDFLPGVHAGCPVTTTPSPGCSTASS